MSSRSEGGDAWCCSRRGTLRSIQLDKAHLYEHQGSSFWLEIRFLSRHFFKYLFGGGARPPTYMVALTATMSLNNNTTLSSLTLVGFPASSRCWATYDAIGAHGGNNVGRLVNMDEATVMLSGSANHRDTGATKN